jgi:hypothetical protein
MYGMESMICVVGKWATTVVGLLRLSSETPCDTSIHSCKFTGFGL